MSDADTAATLQAIGYDIAANDLPIVISAFQRRFRPENFDGVPDPETRARLAALHALVAEVAPSD